MLLIQIGSFVALRSVHYGEGAAPVAGSSVPVAVVPSTLPTTTEGTAVGVSTSAAEPRWVQGIRYATAVINFLGIALVIVLSLVLLLVVKIMLVGRLIGVSRVTSAYIWCIILAVLLFPWQTFLTSHGAGVDFQIPGVLFTWADLQQSSFQTTNMSESVLKWTRFVAYPVFAILLLLLVQGGSSRGIREALGESEGELGELTVRS